ncbi:MAG: lipopolysaccharide biosynthesis protein [Fidelibacterota bacterium]
MFRVLSKTLSLEKDITITVLNALGIILGVLFLNGYMARVHGMETLGEYLLIRRTSYAMVGILLLGMNVGLPNFVAKDPRGFFGHGAVFTFLTFTLPVTAVLAFLISRNLVPGFRPELALPIYVFTLGVCMQNLTYGLFRGHLNIVGGNIFQITGSALLPIGVFFFVMELDVALLVLGVGLLVTTGWGYLLRNKGLDPRKIRRAEVARLWSYGTERVPSFVFQFILLAGVPVMVASQVSYRDLAFLNSSISLVRIFLIVVGPLGLVLLPRVSKALGEQRESEVSHYLGRLTEMGLLLGTIVAVSLTLFGPEILRLWLNDISETGARSVRTILLTIPFYAVVGILRGPIDAASERGYNSLIFVVSVLVLALTFAAARSLGVGPLMAGSMSFLLGHVAACVMSIAVIRHLLNVPRLHRSLYRDLVFAVVGIAGLYSVTASLTSSVTLRMGLCFALTAILTAIYVRNSPRLSLRIFRQHL